MVILACGGGSATDVVGVFVRKRMGVPDHNRG